jgi:hypothetical protein
MELLLTTRLTSRYIAAGILRGIVSFALPLVIVPAFTLLLFVIADLRHATGMNVTTPEAVLLVPALIVASCGLAAMIGLQCSLIAKKTVQSVMISTAIVMLGSGLLLGCAWVVSSGGAAEGFIGSAIRPLTPFSAVQTLIDYESVFVGRTGGTPSAAALTSARVVRTVSSLIAVAIYVAITYSLYTTFVRNFDMTVRRQSA